MTFNSNGKPVFVDKKDKESFNGLLSFIKNRGVETFVMSIEESKPISINQNQIKLWKTIVNLISMESGNDLQTVEHTLNVMKIPVSEMDNNTFNNLLNHAFVVCEEYFNVSISLSSTGNIEIKH
jgi:hypothetical protein